jgi:hypothetical protein
MLITSFQKMCFVRKGQLMLAQEDEKCPLQSYIVYVHINHNLQCTLDTNVGFQIGQYLTQY